MDILEKFKFKLGQVVKVVFRAMTVYKKPNPQSDAM